MDVNRFFVVRHGETKANVMGVNAGTASYPLTKKGKKDAEYLAKMLSKIEISGIFSSPVFRAVETAKILVRHHDLDVKTLEGLTEAKLKPKFVGKKGRLHILSTPEAFDETYEELEARMMNAIQLIKKQASGNVIIVSHGDPIVALLQHVVQRENGKSGYYVLHPDPGSLSVLELRERLELSLFNYHRKQLER